MPVRTIRTFATLVLFSFVLAACGGGGGASTTPVTAASTATGSNSSSTSSETGYTCPASESSASGSSGFAASRRLVRAVNQSEMPTSAGLIAVTYRTGAIPQPASALDARVASADARFVSQTAFDAIGRTMRVLAVSPADAASAAATLKAQPGVIDAQAVQYRYPLATNPYLTSDPFFKGQSGVTSPLYESAVLQGQWDMHVIGLQNAFAYSQPNNGSSITNANALGSTSVKLAIIDTGVDVTHPDLAGSRIVRTECYITNESGVQSTGTYVTDPAGHGTDVTGIAAAATNNDYGFAGTGGNVSLMLYRVFPTPDDNCTNDQTTDPRCGATDVDIASAIDDAVKNGANVINMSLGGGTCTNGVDPDTVEGSAVSNALAHNVVVVAASGNSSGEGVDAPACDSGVIAVGASAYNDGQPNGSSYSGSNKEYVASYSRYGATNDAGSTASWGLVAPGGDATGSSDPDDLHWIENIWTSTPYDSTFDGDCSTDVFGETGDCRTFIEGTSMAAAHVSGAAALVLSVSGTSGPYASPSAMFRLLCTTADNIDASHQGCGRLNVYRAVAAALGDPSPPQ